MPTQLLSVRSTKMRSAGRQRKVTGRVYAPRADFDQGVFPSNLAVPSRLPHVPSHGPSRFTLTCAPMMIERWVQRDCLAVSNVLSLVRGKCCLIKVAFTPSAVSSFPPHPAQNHPHSLELTTNHRSLTTATNTLSPKPNHHQPNT